MDPMYLERLVQELRRSGHLPEQQIWQKAIEIASMHQETLGSLDGLALQGAIFGVHERAHSEFDQPVCERVKMRPKEELAMLSARVNQHGGGSAVLEIARTLLADDRIKSSVRTVDEAYRVAVLLAR